MDRLYHLIVSEEPCVLDMERAQELAVSVLGAEKPKGLPSHMWQGAQECAINFLDESRWYWHLFLCLILVQKRTRDMPDEEVRARLEIENLLMTSIFGG